MRKEILSHTVFGAIVLIATLQLEDITTEWDQIEYIINAFNTHLPEEVHIYDILENYLLDFTDF